MEFTPHSKSASHGIATPLAGGHSRAELNVRTRRKLSHGAWYSTNATTTRHCVQDRERGQEKVHFAGCGRGHELALHGFYEVSMQLLDARTRRRASIRGEHGVRTKADQAPKPHPCDTPARSAAQMLKLAGILRRSEWTISSGGLGQAGSRARVASLLQSRARNHAAEPLLVAHPSPGPQAIGISLVAHCDRGASRRGARVTRAFKSNRAVRQIAWSLRPSFPCQPCVTA